MREPEYEWADLTDDDHAEMRDSFDNAMRERGE